VIHAVRAGSARALLTLTAIALVIAWLLPGRPVPIYDGVGAPDEPYRYVRVPPDVAIRTQPPTTAKLSVPVTDGVPSVIELATSEQGPQAEADIVDRGLSVSSASASLLTATLVPLAPDPSGNGPKIDGNVYRLGWTAGTAAVRFVNHGSDLLYLRATVGPPPRAVFLYRTRPNDAWRPLATDLAGADIYSALIQGPGDYALTREPLPATSATPSAHSGVSPGLLIVAVLVIGMVAIVLIIRLLRVRRVP